MEDMQSTELSPSPKLDYGPRVAHELDLRTRGIKPDELREALADKRFGANVDLAFDAKFSDDGAEIENLMLSERVSVGKVFKHEELEQVVAIKRNETGQFEMVAGKEVGPKELAEYQGKLVRLSREIKGEMMSKQDDKGKTARGLMAGLMVVELLASACDSQAAAKPIVEVTPTPKSTLVIPTKPAQATVTWSPTLTGTQQTPETPAPTAAPTEAPVQTNEVIMTMEQIDANFAIMQELYKDQVKFRALAREAWIAYKGTGMLPHDYYPGHVREIGDPSKAPYIGYLETISSDAPFMGKTKKPVIEGINLGVERVYNAELNANFDVLWIAIEDGGGNLIKIPVMMGDEVEVNQIGSLSVDTNGRTIFDRSINLYPDVLTTAKNLRKSVGKIVIMNLIAPFYGVQMPSDELMKQVPMKHYFILMRDGEGRAAMDLLSAILDSLKSGKTATIETPSLLSPKSGKDILLKIPMGEYFVTGSAVFFPK